jgi:hypothetical protein
MAKRKNETNEDDSRAARHARRRKNAELQESASAEVKSEVESSSESEDDEETEFNLETLEDKVTRMNQNLVHLKVLKTSFLQTSFSLGWKGENLKIDSPSFR